MRETGVSGEFEFALIRPPDDLTIAGTLFFFQILFADERRPCRMRFNFLTRGGLPDSLMRYGLMGISYPISVPFTPGRQWVHHADTPLISANDRRGPW